MLKASCTLLIDHNYEISQTKRNNNKTISKKITTNKSNTHFLVGSLEPPIAQDQNHSVK